MSATDTLMARETAEAATIVRRQIARNADAVARLGDRLRARPPHAVTTLARGSSDNAATYGRYLLETQAGVLTSSVPPSVASLYDATPDMTGTVMVAISQSGRSPDLLAAASAARARGAMLVALVNDEASPLFAMADHAIPLCAGPELSVAATKSFIAALSAFLQIVAEWTGSESVGAALGSLPDLLERASGLDWSAALPLLGAASSLYIVGRGPGFGIAQEAALKFKETCAIHAEAFSAAEVRHGPMAIVEHGFPVLLLGQADESLDGIAALAREFAGRGAALVTAGLPTGAPGVALPVIDADPLVQPILHTAAFYGLINRLALDRGRDPDRPPHLAKVTETI